MTATRRSKRTKEDTQDSSATTTATTARKSRKTSSPKKVPAATVAKKGTKKKAPAPKKKAPAPKKKATKAKVVSKAKSVKSPVKKNTATAKKPTSPSSKNKKTKKNDDDVYSMFKKKNKEGEEPLQYSAANMWSHVLADEDDPSTANMEGISKLAEALKMDAETDLRILVLVWKLGAKAKPAQISKEEWEEGCSELNIDGSLKSLEGLLPSLDLGFLDQEDFKDFYKFCFRFNLHSTHRTLDKDMVGALLELIFRTGATGRITKDRLDSFCAFLEVQTSYSCITLDQWTSFLDFCIECEDLSTYDESQSAWPVLIDEYVEYLEEQQKK